MVFGGAEPAVLSHAAGEERVAEGEASENRGVAVGAEGEDGGVQGVTGAGEGADGGGGACVMILKRISGGRVQRVGFGGQVAICAEQGVGEWRDLVVEKVEESRFLLSWCDLMVVDVWVLDDGF